MKTIIVVCLLFIVSIIIFLYYMCSSNSLKSFYTTYFDEYLDLFPTENDALQLKSKDYLRKYYENSIFPEHINEQRIFFERKKTEFLKLYQKWPKNLVAEIFLFDVNDRLENLQYPFYLMPLNQMQNKIIEYAEIINGSGSLYEIKTATDYKDAMNKTIQFSRWIHQAIENMRLGMDTAYVLPTVIAQAVVKDLKDMIGDCGYKNPNVPQNIKSEWDNVITKYYVNPTNKLIDFMGNEYMPYTRQSISYVALPKGKEMYRYLVKSNTTLYPQEISVEKIHQIGLVEVERIKDEMEKIKEEVQFNGTLREFMLAINNDPSIHYPDTKIAKQQVMDDYKQMQQYIAENIIPKYFDIQINSNYVIKPVPKIREQSAPAAYYMPGSIDGDRGGIFYLNLLRVSAMKKTDVEVLSLHEGNPGHNYQLTISNNNPDIPLFIKAKTYSGYSEGWSLYAENLGTFENALDRFAKLNSEMLRAMRLVLDTGIHFYNWDFEKATWYFMDNSAEPKEESYVEILRYIAIPGQALAYKIGELTIVDQRKKFQGSLKEFHRKFLFNGPGPLSVIKKYM